jgi:hypothetical protein
MYLGEMVCKILTGSAEGTVRVLCEHGNKHLCFTEVEISFTRRATVDVSRKNELVF